MFRPTYSTRLTEEPPFVAQLFVGMHCETYEYVHTREDAVALAHQWRAELLAGGYGLDGAVLDYDLPRDRQTVQ